MPAIEQLLQDDDRRRDQIESFSEIAARLGRGGPPPSERAAEAVLHMIDGAARRGHRPTAH